VLKLTVILFAHRSSERRVVGQSMLDALSQRGLTAVLVPPRLQPIWQEPVERVRPPLSGGGVCLLVVGRLVRSKGYDLLLTAMAELVPTLPAMRLRIVGDGPERVRLSTQAEQLGLSNVVEFVGALGIGDVRAELAHADLFIISSRDEGMPRTLLEAAAAEVPVVATNVGGIPAAAAGWDTVSVVPVDASALAEAVRQVISAPPDAGGLAAVREQVLASYGFATNIDALADLYRVVNRAAGATGGPTGG
jgi:glycosyltransferase involved in cell wall biosynthesis